MQTIVWEKACNTCCPVLCSLSLKLISSHTLDINKSELFGCCLLWSCVIFGLPWYHATIYLSLNHWKKIQHSPAHILSKLFSPFRLKPTIMCLWHLQLKRPCLVWLCCWGPWGSGCVATAPSSWPSTTGPPPVCCSWLAHTLTPAWRAQQPIGPPSWMILIGPGPARRSHLPPLWDRSSLKITWLDIDWPPS